MVIRTNSSQILRLDSYFCEEGVIIDLLFWNLARSAAARKTGQEADEALAWLARGGPADIPHPANIATAHLDVGRVPELDDVEAPVGEVDLEGGLVIDGHPAGPGRAPLPRQPVRSLPRRTHAAARSRHAQPEAERRREVVFHHETVAGVFRPATQDGDCYYRSTDSRATGVVTTV